MPNNGTTLVTVATYNEMENLPRLVEEVFRYLPGADILVIDEAGMVSSKQLARFIGEAVASVLGQDDPDWELWILDNSTDETPQVMEAYRDERIHFVHEPARMDPGSCLNWMLERAVGEHFSYIHTDNRLLPGFREM